MDIIQIKGTNSEIMHTFDKMSAGFDDFIAYSILEEAAYLTTERGKNF